VGVMVAMLWDHPWYLHDLLLSHGYRNVGGYGGQVRATAPQSQPSVEPSKPRPPPSFDALRALQGDDGSNDSDDDRDTSASGSLKVPLTESSDEDKDKEREVGKEATQAEREEAEAVVSQAFADVKERDQMRKQVASASPADLQAMLN